MTTPEDSEREALIKDALIVFLQEHLDLLSDLLDKLKDDPDLARNTRERLEIDPPGWTITQRHRRSGMNEQEDEPPPKGETGTVK